MHAEGKIDTELLVLSPYLRDQVRCDFFVFFFLVFSFSAVSEAVTIFLECIESGLQIFYDRFLCIFQFSKALHQTLYPNEDGQLCVHWEFGQVLCVFLNVCLSVCLSACLSVCLLPVCLSTCCLFICLSVCLYKSFGFNFSFTTNFSGFLVGFSSFCVPMCIYVCANAELLSVIFLTLLINSHMNTCTSHYFLPHDRCLAKWSWQDFKKWRFVTCCSGTISLIVGCSTSKWKCVN